VCFHCLFFLVLDAGFVRWKWLGEARIGNSWRNTITSNVLVPDGCAINRDMVTSGSHRPKDGGRVTSRAAPPSLVYFRLVSPFIQTGRGTDSALLYLLCCFYCGGGPIRSWASHRSRDCDLFAIGVRPGHGRSPEDTRTKRTRVQCSSIVCRAADVSRGVIGSGKVRLSCARAMAFRLVPTRHPSIWMRLDKSAFLQQAWIEFTGRTMDRKWEMAGPKRAPGRFRELLKTYMTR